MFNKQALKILARENARLRGELRRKEKQVSELLDNFIFHKIPERLANRSFSSSPVLGGSGSAPSPDHMTDSYSVLMRELEEEIDKKYPTDLPTLNIDDDD